MAESTPCNLEDVSQAFVESPKYIHQAIANKMRKPKTLFSTLIQRKAFEYGHGYTQYKEEFHGGLNIQDAGESWKIMAKYRAPGTNGENDAGYDPCKSEALMIKTGTEEKSYTIYQAERRTQDICLTDALFFWQIEQQLALWYNSLSNVTLGEWEQITSEAYLTLCEKVIVRQSALDTNTGLDDFTITPATGAVFGGTIAIPAGGLGTIGRLTVHVLDRVYQYLVRQVSDDGFLGMDNGAPLVGIAASQETIGDLIKQDSAEVSALYYANPGINIEGYGRMRTYKNWVQFNDWNAMRYAPNAAGDKLERVYPWVTEPTTIGEAINVNSAYINAPFEVVKVIIKKVYAAQVPAPNPSSIGGGFKFDPVNNIGDFEFMNIQDRCDNPRREKGYFLARYRMAPEPDVNSSYALAILTRRCNTLSVVECTDCTNATTPVSVSATPEVFDDKVAASATKKYILTLADCLDCQIGDRVTLVQTGTGAGTVYGGLVDNFAGTTVVIHLDTAKDLTVGTTWTIACGGTARA
jgi:hypothetical protein